MIVIIGGSFAGVQAALEIRKRKPYKDIVIYEKKDHLGYVPNGINVFLKRQIDRLEDAIRFNEKDLKDNYIDVHLNTECTAINSWDKTVMIKEDGQEKIVSYDKLIIAIGSTQPQYLIEKEKKFVYQTKELNDARRTVEKLQDAESVAILGGGIIGIELAASLHVYNPKLKIIVLEKFDNLLEMAVDNEITERIIEKLNQKEIKFLTAIDFERVEETEEKIKIVTNQGEFETDMLIKAPNLEPNHQFLAQSIDLDIDGTGIVSPQFQASEDIYVLGDMLRLELLPIEERLYMSLVNNAVRSAIVAANHIAAKKELVFQSTKTNVFTICELTVARSGAQQRDERFSRYPIDKFSGVYHVYLEDNRRVPVYLIMFVYPHSKEVIGLQAIAEANISHLANLFSLVVRGKLRAEELAVHDFFFHADYPSDVMHCLNNIAADYLSK
ncbi:pyridine nucleotide-disulfide oxidoreductase [Enterococcus florum]|uniref:Pyridine nucleotide-disulfide oxidoreductase n=1 Tax=Enterococcus florum TaxID=2480627 RepID=A0A4P5P3A5_9ENTE|nr:FAD/NAD(P)-binding oxidoreductase [Enterococcus florum]GCF92215.1 pyridine nucleotide-disulfide oxidoreductase [Enterococcus florum]